MATEVDDAQGTNIAGWAGWDASMLDPLLDAESGPHAVGFALARLLGSRILPSPTSRFRFRLYRYCHENGSYCFVGAWNERCLEDDAVPQPFELLERQEAMAAAPDPDMRRDHFLDDELFLPLETKNGVLGFGVLRVDSEHEPLSVSTQDLHFLSRLGGAALGRLNESDRAVRMHRSFESVSLHLDGVLSMTEEAIVLVDALGIVRIANEAALDLLRQSGNELIGRPISSVLAQDAAASLHHALLDAEESEGRISAQVTLAHRGRVRLFDVAVQQLQTDIEFDPTLLVRFRPMSEADRGCESHEREWAESEPTTGRDNRLELFVLPTEEAETLRRHVRSIRGYLGLLRDEVQPRSRSFDLFRQLDVQMEWLQAQADVHALLESIRTGEVNWQTRSIRVETLIDRALSRVSARHALRGVEIERRIEPRGVRVSLDVEKWAVALGVLFDRVTEENDVRRLRVTVDPAPELSISIRIEASSDRPISGSLGAGEDDRSHGLTLVRHMVDLHEGELRMVADARGVPVTRLVLPIALVGKGRRGHAA